MGAWGIKALERDEGLDVLDILKNEYVPEHPVMDLGEMIELMKEEVMLGADFSQIDFLFDNTAMALAELYFQWKDNSKLDYDHEEAIWDKVTGFTASKEALAFLLRQLTDIKNEVPDEDGIREILDLWKNEDSGEIAPEWLEHLNQLIDRLDSEQEARKMYIKKYWGNFIGGSDDSLNLVAFLVDQKKEEIPLSEIFAKIGLDKQNWDFRQTVEYLEFTHSDGVEMDFHFAIDVVTDLAAILLECSVSGSVNLQDLDEYNTPARRIRITVTPEEHDAMNKVGFSCIIKQGDDYLYSFRIEPTTGGSFFRMLTEDLRLNTGLLDTFLPLVKANYLDFIDRFEADPVEALQPVCAPFTEAEDYSWFIYVREQMVERYGTAEQMEEYRRQAELRGTPGHKAKNWMGSMLFHLSHANDVDQAWASSRTREELDQVVEPFVQAKRQTGQWTQEDEAGYQLYRQETDPKKRTFRVWYLIANPRGLPKEFVQKELEFRWKLFPEKKEEPK